jgi:type I restriction enzyme M protein
MTIWIKYSNNLPIGVFNPYTGIRTNLLFFTKGPKTEQVWFYEHPYPPGAKSYNKGQAHPHRGVRAGAPGGATRPTASRPAWKTNRAWRVSIDQIKAGNFNLDLKNPHNADTGPGDVDHLLPEYEKLLAQIAETRSKLKAQLMEALNR